MTTTDPSPETSSNRFRNHMTIRKLFAIAVIFGCTAFAWIILGETISIRTSTTHNQLLETVRGNWGDPVIQSHPAFHFESDEDPESRETTEPTSADIDVAIQYTPKKKGLLWYRTYVVDFDASYLLKNSGDIPQKLVLICPMPGENVRYEQFAVTADGQDTDILPENSVLKGEFIIEPGAETNIRIAYRTTAMDRWEYSLKSVPRVRNLRLSMSTDFDEINIPAGTESPTARQESEQGWELEWKYADVIGANAIGMDMPAALNPGPVAARITYFAPFSLLFFFAVIVILGMVRHQNLHPMNFFFLGAGCFAFQLLFAYLLDLISVHFAFVLSASVSLLLVTGYLWLAAGRSFAIPSGAAQLFYMILFSYSFFFNGLTGLTVTIGSIITLAVLMVFTAKVDWDAIFEKVGRKAEAVPPDLPTNTAVKHA